MPRVTLSAEELRSFGKKYNLNLARDEEGDEDGGLEVVFYPGATELDQLIIAADSIVVVDGTLTVDGPVIDHYFSNDPYSNLFVTGDLLARNAITGQEMTVLGSVAIRHLWYVIAWDDLTSIHVGGVASAGAQISLGGKTLRARQHRFGKVFDDQDERATTHPVDAIVLPDILDPKKPRDARKLHERMLKNEPILAGT